MCHVSNSNRRQVSSYFSASPLCVNSSSTFAMVPIRPLTSSSLEHFSTCCFVGSRSERGKNEEESVDCLLYGDVCHYQLVAIAPSMIDNIASRVFIWISFADFIAHKFIRRRYQKSEIKVFLFHRPRLCAVKLFSETNERRKANGEKREKSLSCAGPRAEANNDRACDEWSKAHASNGIDAWN